MHTVYTFVRSILYLYKKTLLGNCLSTLPVNLREVKEDASNADVAATGTVTENKTSKNKKDGEEVLVPVDSSTDVGIMKFQPQKVEFKDLRAKPEGGENPNKLVSWLTEAEINEVRFFASLTKFAIFGLHQLILGRSLVHGLRSS